MLGVEVGIDPDSWLSARSSQYSLERLPREWGISPVKLLEFSALLHRIWLQVLHTLIAHNNNNVIKGMSSDICKQ